MTPLLRPAALVVAFALVTHAAAADKRPMQVDDLFKFKRVASPRISPDGKLVVYQLTTVSLEANKSSTALWVAATDGKTPPKQLLDPAGKKDTNPRWAPDGKRILFESNRSGTTQLWLTNADGAEPKQLTTLSTGASNGVWSPDGAHVAFVSAVYPEFSEKPFDESDKLNKEKDEAIEKNPVQARVFTKLFYRHWNEYVGDKRQHLFVMEYQAHPLQRVGFVRDVTPGDRDAYPTSSTFESGDDFTFSPDGNFLIFTAVPEKGEAWSTNYDLCRVPVKASGGRKPTVWETLTTDNKAADSGPKFSPDGKRLAWRAQSRPGNEADKWDIVVADCNPDGTISGKPSNLTAKHDLSVHEFVYSKGDGFLFTADQGGLVPIVTLQRLDENWVIGNLRIEGGMYPAEIGSNSSLSVSSDGQVLAYAHAHLYHPAEVMVNQLQGVASVPISEANNALLAQLDLPKPESVSIPVEGGVKMQMWVLKPPGFDPAKKWPVAYIVHGGPQVALNDAWSFRWNAQTWAARGYVVAMPNFRGSPGFGQKFTDEISGDWGGKAYRDLVAGLDYLEKLPYVDKDRIAAAGGSFGGYMMNWFAVNDVAPRFKCFITHCSVWNFESMWGTTDELWFDEFDHGGLPWEVPGKYAEFSPHKKAGNLGKYKVPMLVIHNDLDFRCPIGQGHELFAALQRQGVPSRFVNFPDEGHWVLKPRNSQYWHKEVFGWLEKYCPPGGK